MPPKRKSKKVTARATTPANQGGTPPRTANPRFDVVTV